MTHKEQYLGLLRWTATILCWCVTLCLFSGCSNVGGRMSGAQNAGAPGLTDHAGTHHPATILAVDTHDQSSASSGSASQRPIREQAFTSTYTSKASGPPVPQPDTASSGARPGFGGKSYPRSVAVTKPAAADSALRQQLTIASLSDNQLGDIRGGLDAGSGVELNFAFQQATLVDHNVVQNIVLPTLTVATNSAGNPTASVSSIPAGSISGSNIAASPVSTASFAGLGMAGAPSEIGRQHPRRNHNHQQRAIPADQPRAQPQRRKRSDLRHLYSGRNGLDEHRQKHRQQPARATGDDGQHWHHRFAAAASADYSRKRDEPTELRECVSPLNFPV